MGTTDQAHGPRRYGPRKLFRGVGRTPLTFKMTPSGVRRLDEHTRRTGLRRGDFLQWLVMEYGCMVPSGLLDEPKPPAADEAVQ